MNISEKKYLVFAALIVLSVFFFIPFSSQSEDFSGDQELSQIKKQFGAVLNLTGNAAKEINAIANLLTPGSGMKAINLAHNRRVLYVGTANRTLDGPFFAKTRKNNGRYSISEQNHITIKDAAKKLTGAKRRAFQAQVAIDDYLGSRPRLTERTFVNHERFLLHFEKEDSLGYG